MRAFTNTEVTKERLMSALRVHRAADRFIQGTYWSADYPGGARGCAVGCTVHDFRPGKEDDHALYEPLFGIPAALAAAEDAIFEGLWPEEAREWPLRFIEAIQPGADLRPVAARSLARVVERRLQRTHLYGGEHLVREFRECLSVVAEALRAHADGATPETVQRLSRWWAPVHALGGYLAQEIPGGTWYAHQAVGCVHKAIMAITAEHDQDWRWVKGALEDAAAASWCDEGEPPPAHEYHWMGETLLEELAIAGAMVQPPMKAEPEPALVGVGAGSTT